MALNIQIPYRGDAYLYGGISSAGQGLAQGIEQMAQNLRQAKAYRAMAVDGLGMDPDQVDKMSLGELQGHMQAQAVKSAMANQAAQAQERQARAAELMMRNEEAQAWPEFAKALMEQGPSGAAATAAPAASPEEQDLGNAQAPTSNVQPGAPGSAGPAVAPDGGAGNRFSPQAIMGAMTKMGSTNPRLAAAMARTLIPQMMNGGTATGPQGWMSPAGNPFVYMGHTLMPDRPGFDPSTMMGGAQAPEGYTAVPTGPNKVQYLKTAPPQLPSTFHSALDQVQGDVASAQSTLNQPDTAFKNADEAKTMRGYAQKRLDTATARGKATIDRYHLTGYLTDEQRDQFYDQLGLGKATQGKAAAPAADQKPAPLPKDKTMLKSGQIYATARGNAKWDGKQFVPQ